MNFQLKGFFLFLLVSWVHLAALPGLTRGRILMQVKKPPIGGFGGASGPYSTFPYLGTTYTIQNKPYADTILVPYVEPDNAASGITVGANLVIATPNDVTPQPPKGGCVKRARRLRDRPSPPTATKLPI